MALVLVSQFSTAACSSVRCAGAGPAGGGQAVTARVAPPAQPGAEQAATARLAPAASETAAARSLPVWFMSAVPSCRVVVPTLGIPAARGIGPVPRTCSGRSRKSLRADPDASGIYRCHTEFVQPAASILI